MPGATTTASSNSPAVDAYMSSLTHPLKDVVVALRAAVLSAHTSIGEEIKWNAPAFFYTGPMAPFSAKEFRRHLAVCNLPPRKDCIRLVFLRAGTVADPSGLLEGSYPDGRRIATFQSVADVKAGKKALVAILQAQLEQLDA